MAVCVNCERDDHDACADGQPEGPRATLVRCDCCCTGADCFDCRPLSAAQIAEIQADIRAAKEALREER